MKSVLAVAGSARRGGNSDTLLDSFLEPLQEAGFELKKIIPSQLSISPCRS